MADHNDNYTYCREWAVQWLDSYQEEIEARLGVESWPLYLYTPLLDVLTGGLMAHRALQSLGGPECVAYRMQLPEATLTNKVARLCFDIMKDWGVSSKLAIQRCKSDKRNEIENAFGTYHMAKDDRTRRAALDTLTDDIYAEAHEWGHAALDSFVFNPKRRF